jgi:hypothetical protein
VTALASSLLLASADAAQRVGSGKLVGGWEYVWAAYLVLWIVLAVYGGQLWLVHRREVDGKGDA